MLIGFEIDKLSCLGVSLTLCHSLSLVSTDLLAREMTLLLLLLLLLIIVVSLSCDVTRTFHSYNREITQSL